MTKAILTTKIDPTYDDLPEERYHFPRTYLRQVEEAKGDWIIYYEPRRISGELSSRGGRQATSSRWRSTARIPSATAWPYLPLFTGCSTGASSRLTTISPSSSPKITYRTRRCGY